MYFQLFLDIEDVIIRNFKINAFENNQFPDDVPFIFTNSIMFYLSKIKTLQIQLTFQLCGDTNVFDFASKPPIRWDEVKKELTDNGASRIIHIQAKRSIEDWFAYKVCD